MVNTNFCCGGQFYDVTWTIYADELNWLRGLREVVQFLFGNAFQASIVLRRIHIFYHQYMHLDGNNEKDEQKSCSGFWILSCRLMPLQL